VSCLAIYFHSLSGAGGAERHWHGGRSRAGRRLAACRGRSRPSDAMPGFCSTSSGARIAIGA
jgi:hypothetical protein